MLTKPETFPCTARAVAAAAEDLKEEVRQGQQEGLGPDSLLFHLPSLYAPVHLSLLPSEACPAWHFLTCAELSELA